VDCNVLLVSYRGYGLSEGSPSESGFLADAQAILNHLLARNDIDKSLIFVLGTSIGGAVAIALATANPDKLRGLILENTFTSLPDVTRALMPFLGPFTWAIRDRWNNVQRIKDLTVPILFISGRNDELVPPMQMEKLHAAAEKSVMRRIAKIARGEHNDTWLQSSYIGHFRQFVLDVSEESHTSST